MTHFRHPKPFIPFIRKIDFNFSANPNCHVQTDLLKIHLQYRFNLKLAESRLTVLSP